jgi:UDP-GlcNAc:undecaprenyl-phosphate GlcNAc-1-phosphate transferase
MKGEWLMVALVPGMISAAIVAVLLRTRWTRALADHPNERSLHARPVARVGGLGILAGALPVAAAYAPFSLRVALGCALAIAVVSLLDDIRSLPVEVRLPAHFAAATLAVLAIGASEFDAAHWALAAAIACILALVWMTDLFNFMDGADGLAGAMAAIGFAAFALGAFQAGREAFALAAAALASASVGFLAHNLPPARAFMGDAGSIPLGFLAGAFGLHGVLAAAWPWWFPLLVFSPFIVDATATILRRLLRGERIWKAHRTHGYQRLVLAGWSHRRLLAWACVLMLAVAGSALAGRAAGPMVQCGILFCWTALYALLIVAIERRTRRPGTGG